MKAEREKENRTHTHTHTHTQPHVNTQHAHAHAHAHTPFFEHATQVSGSSCPHFGLKNFSSGLYVEHPDERAQHLATRKEVLSIQRELV